MLAQLVSAPAQSAETYRTAEVAAQRVVEVLDKLQLDDSESGPIVAYFTGKL